MKYCLASLLLAATAAGAAEPATPANSDGARLFESRCALCHRGTGPGVFMLDRRLGSESSILEQRNDLVAAYVSNIVRVGIGSMPRFSRGEISDDELALIAAYLAKADKQN